MVNRLMHRRILRQPLMVQPSRKSSIKPTAIQRVFWSAVPLPEGVYVAPLICKAISASVIKVPFQQKTSLPSVVKPDWLGLNVLQYPSKILIVGPKGLQELEFNPQQRLLLRNTGKREKHLFLLSGPVKRFHAPRGSAHHPTTRTPQHPSTHDEHEQNQKITPNVTVYKRSTSFHKLSVSNLKNAIKGVDIGFTKQLRVKGVGFRAFLKSIFIKLDLGFSHSINIRIPSELDINMEGTDLIIIQGSCKWAVGKFAAEIRLLRPAEPYKGKGIAYEGEVIRYKSAKTGK